MKRLILALATALIAASLVCCADAQDAALRRIIEKQVGDQRTELFTDDALRVLICGSSSPMPHATRAKPCTAIFAAGKMWVVDVGPGSWNRVGGWRVPGERIGAVLLTHYHSDHIGDLGEWNMQTWVAGRPGPLQVIGPVGVERVVAGFAEAYALDTHYRIAHHGAEFIPEEAGRMQAAPIEFAADGAPVVVHEADGLRITAFLVNHAPIVPAVGYRFDWRGRSVVVSGDTVKCPGLIAAAKNADVLVHEAQAQHIVKLIGEAAAKAGRPRAAKIMHDIASYHTSPVEAAEIANEANVKLLVMTHLTPPPPNKIAEHIYVRGVDEVRPKGWLLADDGLLVELPADSDAVKTRKLE